MKFNDDELALIVDCVSEVIAREEAHPENPGDMAEFLEQLRTLQKKLDKVM
jgi:hypothetical protein